MRVVRGPDELADALEAAQREAEAAFGDDRVFCERYVERPRHVEVQLLADEHGEVRAVVDDEGDAEPTGDGACVLERE